MKNVLCLFAFGASLILSALGAKADDPSPAFVLPSKDPMLVLMLPDGTGQQKISIAVSQALLAEEWENLNWDHNVTIATTEDSRIKIKVFAVAGDTDVKLFAALSTEKNIPDDRMKKVAIKALRSLEKAIAVKLKLDFRPDKNGTTDSAIVK